MPKSVLYESLKERLMDYGAGSDKRNILLPACPAWCSNATSRLGIFNSLMMSSVVVSGSNSCLFLLKEIIFACERMFKVP